MRFCSPARVSAGAGLLSALWMLPTGAHADDAPITWSLGYTADVAGVVSGQERAGRFLDNIDASADVSLEHMFGWTGAHVFAKLLSNSGGAPNDVAGTLQGVDNIEVTRPRAKLYEFWIEQAFADDRGSLLAGLYDLNSEFYQNDAAGLLLEPAFGIGSELAATGPNGPSIFPSTALALRASWKLTAHQTVRAAAINASAGVIGDPGGVDYSFNDGALLIAEWARRADVTLKIGAWRYTESQNDIRDVDGLGAPRLRVASGAYLSLEGEVWHDDAHTATAFLRTGVADGDTTSYAGGWQAGLLVGPVFAQRPESQFSIGVNQGFINPKERANMRDGGLHPASAEQALEITYSDQVLEHVTLQPDLQFIHNPGAERDRDDIVVAALRLSIAY